MPEFSDLAAKGQDFVIKTVDAVLDTVKDAAPALEKVVDLMPTPSEVVEQVTATANELLALSQDIQNKVIAALQSNA